MWTSKACFAPLLIAVAACSSAKPSPPARVAILIGSADTDGGDLRPAYDWALESVNAQGGPGGRRLEAQYFPLSEATLASTAAQEQLAAQILGDPDMVAAVGVFSFAMAPKFIAAGLPYITPETGDDDVFRAFSAGGLVWRTLESDSTQLWFLLAEAKEQGEAAQKTKLTVGLLTTTDPYGSTFFDWFGFHALELGLTAYSPVQFDPANETCDAAVTRLLAQGVPDYLIAAPSDPNPVAQASCIVKALKSHKAASKVLFSDSVHVPELVAALGADGEGIVGFDDSPDPDTGFEAAFNQRTSLPLPDHAANAFDAIALLAYGLEQAGGQSGPALDTGLRAIVDGDGPDTGWDATGIQQALGFIRAGQHPDIRGASGPLRFDKDLYTDPLATFYERWAIEGGALKTTGYVTTETKSSPTVVSQTAVARGLKAKTGPLASGGGTDALPPLRQNWALIAATSSTWANYRHQADALAHYQALKANGFDDEHIVLVMEDDLAAAPENLLPGQVINVPGGPDVHAGAASDYKGKSLSAAQLLTILAGGSDPNLPAVLHSTAEDNIYVLLVGHGGVDGPYVGMDARALSTVEADHFIAPALLAKTIADMHAKHQFRRMMIAVDACHSGVLGPALESLAIPDVLLVTAAADTETSLSANYAAQLKQWAADQFSFALVTRVGESAPLNIDALYTRLYDAVSGSHVQVFNEQNFGDTTAITLDEFTSAKH